MKFLGSLLQFIDGRLTGIKTPASDTDAANKKYVDDSVYFTAYGVLMSTDLNLVRESGIYELYSGYTYDNSPITTPLHGTLIVFTIANRRLQIIHTFLDDPATKTWAQVASAKSSATTYVRTYLGVWSTWR